MPIWILFKQMEWCWGGLNCEVTVQVGGGGVKLNGQWSMNVFQDIQSLYGCKE
jgi:hypothetical protein